jgi:hypothetical protein
MSVKSTHDAVSALGAQANAQAGRARHRLNRAQKEDHQGRDLLLAAGFPLSCRHMQFGHVATVLVETWLRPTLALRLDASNFTWARLEKR